MIFHVKIPAMMFRLFLAPIGGILRTFNKRVFRSEKQSLSTGQSIRQDVTGFGSAIDLCYGRGQSSPASSALQESHESLVFPSEFDFMVEVADFGNNKLLTIVRAGI